MLLSAPIYAAALTDSSAFQGLRTSVVPVKATGGSELSRQTDEARDTVPIDALWPRVRGSFGFNVADRAKVRTDARAELKRLLRLRGEIYRATTRAEPFLYHVFNQIHERGLPAELALLPFVESGYDPFARSHQSALGIWQFMPATGKQFGLSRTAWIDERRDVVRSTSAALDYIEYLYRRLGNDWLLAIAAYNCGEGKVRRARRKAGKQLASAEGESIYWSLRKYLPKETQAYVPRLLAWATVIEDPNRFDVRLSPVANRAYFEEIQIGQQIDVNVAAKLAAAPLAQIKRLNARLLRGTTAPNGPHYIIVPINHSTAMSGRLAELRLEHSEWINYAAQPGESFKQIANHYGISEQTLRKANKVTGTSPDKRITLRIPKPMPIRGLTPATRVTIPTSGESIDYEVEQGDSLWKIAKRFGVRVRELAAWNGISQHAVLKPGRTLKVWIIPGKIVRTLDHAVTGHVPYVVQEGDSLWVIAQRFDVSIRRLRRSNRLQQDVIRPGQTLQVPVATES
ncbi:MAG: LysM peptidoglycan-binding domain-containing protein [Gammaproteobacteria bacterium]|nr:LysM peptidoglycan-binding domain-containing protein [Gammaproteobacteria bacterium]